MHLLNIQSGILDDENIAIDLNQSPADIIIISSADSELANIATVHDIKYHLSLRLVNFLQIKHPMSIDNYIENTLKYAKLVILRLLGGKMYWSYGVDQIYNTCKNNNIKLCILPGDSETDEQLIEYNTISFKDMNNIWQYFIHGGDINAINLLNYCNFLLNKVKKPAPAKLFLNAGIYWPGKNVFKLNDLSKFWQKCDRSIVAIIFYRSLLEVNNTLPIDYLINALNLRSLNALPIFVSSLKDLVSIKICKKIFKKYTPSIILNATSFAVSSFDQNEINGNLRVKSVLEEPNCPIMQIVLSGQSIDAWLNNTQGLLSRDLVMNVSLTEVDGRILTRAISFKKSNIFNKKTQSYIVKHEPLINRINYVVDLTLNWIRLKSLKSCNRKVSFILANYPNKNSRIGNGVGLDVPQSTINMLNVLKNNGYYIKNLPLNGNDLIKILKFSTTNFLINKKSKLGGEKLSLKKYKIYFKSLSKNTQNQINKYWGNPKNDPFYNKDYFHLPIKIFGNISVSIQPSRGYNIDPKKSYHDPSLVPTHGYLAFYLWQKEVFKTNAYIHNGKHGNLEWLPGKALALSKECYPEIALGSVPNIYPFIVNDPGEGTQAKRRISAVILDHLTPPLTRAENYGPLRDLEALIDEYFVALGIDQRRLKYIQEQIFYLMKKIGLDQDCNIYDNDNDQAVLSKLDNHLCDLKELQIRDGLHIFGSSPKDLKDKKHWLETNLLVALMRVPRGIGKGNDMSFIRAISNDLNLDFDPLDCEMAITWKGKKNKILQDLTTDIWRTNGDTVERIEILAQQLVKGIISLPKNWYNTKKILMYINKYVRPKLYACGVEEMNSLLIALNGEFVSPGPSGAPTRGRLDILPTGKNFYSIDNRSLPTPSAWSLGKKSAENLFITHAQTHGCYLKNISISLWGTANMRTGGDDIAQAMALIGVNPKWDKISWRVIGFEIIPLVKLNRPRVDVTMRISGFFRDAFPQQIILFDKAIRAVALLDEEEKYNPIATNYKSEVKQLLLSGLKKEDAFLKAGFRIFGSKPGAYGAGLQTLIDENLWNERSDFAKAYLSWGSYVYGEKNNGDYERNIFKTRLKKIEAIVQNQDNREHDILDSDDYYQFEGGLAASVEYVSKRLPIIYHNDHTRPEKPIIRTLEQEVARILRGRAVNPKWLEGVMRHGYKGGFEMTATVDYLYAFAATTNAVKDHHFEAIYESYIENKKIYNFLQKNNIDALISIINRLIDAQKRNLWKSKRNVIYYELKNLLLKNNNIINKE